MGSDMRIRASDADRDRAAAALREHLAAGRLTTEEFDERLDKAYVAKTLGELDDLMADLPRTGPGPLPGTSLERSAARPPLTSRGSAGPVETGHGRFSPAWRAAWGSWLGVSLFLLVIWLASGASGGLWFLWVALALGALMLGRQITGAPARRERRLARPRRSHRYRDRDQAR
jgi:Domain of unknown function (DUF1707)